jgi:peptide/nickel transport system permease protein
MRSRTRRFASGPAVATETVARPVLETAEAPPTTLFQDFLRRLRKDRLAVAGGLVVLFMMLLAVLAPWIAPYDPNALDLSAQLVPPRPGHWFGTDDLGRDVLSRMVYGAQISLSVGFVAVGIAFAIGIFLGAVAGYYGGRLDAFIMWLVDVMLVFPSIFLILAVIAFVGPSLFNIMVIIGVTSWMGVARLVRGQFLELREREFVAAVRAQGARAARIIFRHILPNALAPVLVSATFGVAGAILLESGLSFLGLGVPPPRATWGGLLTDGKAMIEVAPWLTVFPGLAIFVTTLAYNLLGQGIRDALDPRLRS